MGKSSHTEYGKLYEDTQFSKSRLRAGWNKKRIIVEGYVCYAQSANAMKFAWKIEEEKRTITFGIKFESSLCKPYKMTQSKIFRAYEKLQIW